MIYNKNDTIIKLLVILIVDNLLTAMSLMTGHLIDS